MRGDVLPSESSVTRDVVTDVQITQLTRHRGHSHHLYFTNPGWWDGGRRLLVSSDRHDQTNLYSIELANGQLTQITEGGLPEQGSFHLACVNPAREEACFWRGRELVAVDLRRLAERVLGEVPAGWNSSMLTCTADGRWLCGALVEDLRARPGGSPRLRGYVGFREFFLARPRSRVFRVAVAGGPLEIVHEEQAWITHVNTSPTQPHLLSYCHEGPWHEVPQRIWGLDLRDGRTWKIRPQVPGEAIGHEYWMADGLTLGYHGQTRAGEVFGAVRHDNQSRVEAPFPHDSQHFHSHSLDLIVGDGRPHLPYLMLWRFRDGGFEGPRMLCWHRGSAHVQAVHVHPRLTPDGAAVLYTSDESGYGNVYLAALPAFESLMTLEQWDRSPRKPWVPFAWVKPR